MTKQEWIAALEADTAPGVRLVYADWLEEEGELRLATGWRLLVECGNQPFALAGLDTYQVNGDNFCWFEPDVETKCLYDIHAGKMGLLQAGNRVTERQFQVLHETYSRNRGEPYTASGAVVFTSRYAAEEALVQTLLTLGEDNYAGKT